MIKFSEMKYSRPDLREPAEEMKRITADLQNAKTYEEAHAAFLTKNSLEMHIMTVKELAQIRHDIDTRDTFYEGVPGFGLRFGFLPFPLLSPPFPSP